MSEANPVSSPALLAPVAGFYQVAYVTTDYDRALERLNETHGLAKVAELRQLRYPPRAGQGDDAAHNRRRAMTTDLDDVFSRERIRRVEARQQYLVQLRLVLRTTQRDQRCMSGFNVSDPTHLSRDRDCVRTAQTNDSESSASSGCR